MKVYKWRRAKADGLHYGQGAIIEQDIIQRSPRRAPARAVWVVCAGAPPFIDRCSICDNQIFPGRACLNRCEFPGNRRAPAPNANTSHIHSSVFYLLFPDGWSPPWKLVKFRGMARHSIRKIDDHVHATTADSAPLCKSKTRSPVEGPRVATMGRRLASGRG